MFSFISSHIWSISQNSVVGESVPATQNLMGKRFGKLKVIKCLDEKKVLYLGKVE